MGERGEDGAKEWTLLAVRRTEAAIAAMADLLIRIIATILREDIL